MTQITHNSTAPPSYEDAIAKLPTHFELLSMTPSQLEHQTKVERLEHERNLRAAELTRVNSEPASFQFSAITSVSTRTRPQSVREARHGPQSATSLQTTLTTIIGTPPDLQNGSHGLSINAQQLRKLLRRIMKADYTSPRYPGHTLHLFPYSWADRHMDAIYFLHPWESRHSALSPPVLTRRVVRLRSAAEELDIPCETVRTLILQHHPLSRRRKYTIHRRSLYDPTDCEGRGDEDVLAVEMCRDAFQVIPTVAETDEEAALLLEGVVRVARQEGWFGDGHVIIQGGSVEKIEARARWYRERRGTAPSQEGWWGAW